MGNDASEKKDQEERIRENGQVTLGGGRKGRIHLLSIIGEIEGHENLSGSTKTTKYEHILPELAKVEDDPDIDGILMLINTVGGDVSCGLALAEMLASLKQAHGLPGHRGQPFHRRAPGCGFGLFVYRTHGHHDGPSGADDRNGHRSCPDV